MKAFQQQSIQYPVTYIQEMSNICRDFFLLNYAVYLHVQTKSVKMVLLVLSNFYETCDRTDGI